MWGKIGLEEHFAIPETLDDSRGFFPDRIWGELRARLLDLHDDRLRLMDECGIEDAVVAQRAGGAGDPRPGARQRCRPQGQRLSCERSPETARSFPGPRRVADA